MTTPTALWRHLETSVLAAAGVQLDVSRMGLEPPALQANAPKCRAALDAMRDLEAGAIANPDEQRRVGHYWLRTPKLAPDPELTRAVVDMNDRVKDLASRVHRGEVRGSTSEALTELLVVGIGGSALGPQLLADALGQESDRMRTHFLDNTDPDGFDRVLHQLGERLKNTLVLVISKSGGTKETRNAMLETMSAFRQRGLEFAPHAVAITEPSSALDELARQQGWLERLPLWSWVGGRTSLTSAVGLAPAALQGIDIDALLDGARAMDAATRQPEPSTNAAMLLALAWYVAGNGRGEKAMVVLPYKDRLALFSRYLQQLVMESLGKELDLSGQLVHQGLTVYGNKGSTDQHSFVQQLRDGLDNVFVTFIQVLKDRDGPSIQVEDGVSSGDYLLGFLLGTRDALYEAGRKSLLLTLPEVSPKTLGAVVALYERAVGFYASLINVNAYHQPGVEAGKRAAADALSLQVSAVRRLKEMGRAATADEIATAMGDPELAETVYRMLEHLAFNGRQVHLEAGERPCDGRFSPIDSPD